MEEVSSTQKSRTVQYTFEVGDSGITNVVGYRNLITRKIEINLPLSYSEEVATYLETTIDGELIHKIESAVKRTIKALVHEDIRGDIRWIIS